MIIFSSLTSFLYQIFRRCYRAFVDRRRLHHRTPGPVPFETCIFSYYRDQSFQNMPCLPNFEFRTSLTYMPTVVFADSYHHIGLFFKTALLTYGFMITLTKNQIWFLLHIIIKVILLLWIRHHKTSKNLCHLATFYKILCKITQCIYEHAHEKIFVWLISFAWANSKWKERKPRITK